MLKSAYVVKQNALCLLKVQLYKVAGLFCVRWTWVIERKSGTLPIETQTPSCQTADCGRRKPHVDFGGNTSSIVPYRHLPQTLRGVTADCCSLV